MKMLKILMVLSSIVAAKLAAITILTYWTAVVFFNAGWSWRDAVAPSIIIWAWIVIVEIHLKSAINIKSRW